VSDEELAPEAPDEEAPVRVTSGRKPMPSRMLQIVDVPIGDIDYNPKNPNRMQDNVFQAEMDSILTYGFVDPCLVRPYAVEEVEEEHALLGRLQMIDGEHRVRCMHQFREVGLPPGAHPELVDLVKRWEIPCVIRPMTRAWAEKLILIFMETRGKGDTVKVGELLSHLASQMSMEDLIKGLPYDEKQMQELIKVGQFDWDQYAEQQDEDQRQRAENKEGFTLALTGPKNILSTLIAALKQLKKQRGGEWSDLKWREK